MKSLPPSHHDKAALRQSLLHLRRNINDDIRTRWNAAIADRLENWLTLHPVATLGVFWPIRKEPDLLDLYKKIAGLGVRLALPVVIAKDEPLGFAAWAPDDAMEKDAFGVPVPAQLIFVTMPETLLVPCVGFNEQGFRLGYGGGFYDRTLAREPKPLAIGIAYACQKAVFEIGAHDIALDMIITEAGV
jgi:5-formyltetrahydrofolate cyclo-ligase